MIAALIHVLIVLIVLGFIWWIVGEILNRIPIAAPFRQMIDIVALIIVLLVVVSLLLPIAGIHIL